jgi:heme oxygenase
MKILDDMFVPPVLVALRHATHDFHKRVEKLTPFFRKDFDRSAYLRWLDLMFAFYRPIDSAVEISNFRSQTNWDYQPRSVLIQRDTELLANRGPKDVSDSVGGLAELSTLTTIAQIAGMLYVVEGSALGGNILLKVLGRSAGVTAAAGASFFAPHGELLEIRWKEYVQLIAHQTTSPEFQADVVSGAVTTFKVLHDWIGQEWHD